MTKQPLKRRARLYQRMLVPGTLTVSNALIIEHELTPEFLSDSLASFISAISNLQYGIDELKDVPRSKISIDVANAELIRFGPYRPRFNPFDLSPDAETLNRIIHLAEKGRRETRPLSVEEDDKKANND